MRFAWVLVIVTGCFQSHEVICDDGRICPEQTVCLQLAASNQLLCAREEDVAACASSAEFDACTLPAGVPGACYGATTGGLVCQPSGCGNAIKDPGEACDDGNIGLGDGCSQNCLSNETCGNGIIDPVRLVGITPVPNEVCDDFASLGHDGCTSGCQLEAPRWQRTVISPGPALSQHRMTYDPIRRHVVMFGGVDDSVPVRPRSEVWEWDGVAWSEVETVVHPSARYEHAFAYDAASHRMIAFGGFTGSPTGDTWTWDGDAWTALSPAGGPTPRSGFGAAYDTHRKRLVVFGGFEVTPAETWTWSGQQWKRLTTPAGMASCGTSPVMGYDAGRDRVVLAGGDVGTNAVQRTWELDGETWTEIPTTTPQDLFGAAFAYDVVGKRMLAYGGGSPQSSDDPVARTLAWDGQQWTDLQRSAPGPLRRAAMASDPVRGQLVMHGGVNSGCGAGSCQVTSTTWIWDGTDWSQPAPAVDPGKRARAASAYDPARGTLVMFGGNSTVANTPLGDTWELTDGHWTQVATSGPPPRVDGAMAYDAVHKQMVLFGGRGFTSTPLPSETWLWDGATWSRATPSTPAPSPRTSLRMAYDTSRSRVVLFGGVGELDDTWEWDGAGWLQLHPAHVPPGRKNHMLAYDLAARKIVLFGGFAVIGGITQPVSDTWTWDGVDWTAMPPSAVAPRLDGAIGWNPARQRLVLFGGFPTSFVSGVALDDSWEWDGSTWTQVFASTVPIARGSHAAFPAPDGSGLMVYGGNAAFGTALSVAAFGDLWRLSYAGAQPYERCAAEIDRDGDLLEGCNDPDCAYRCAPFCVATEIGTAACTAAGPHCGDGVCDSPRESCRLCPADCGACVGACGDGFCDPGEVCLGDCP